MANNQYVNKVDFGNQTIMDISSDTVTADTLISGYTAHDRSGAAITGSLSTFVPSGSTAAAGLVPAPSTTAGTTAFLCEDGTWKVPVNTTYSVMTGASSSTAGTSGLVPAPSAGDENKFLAGDGTYKSGGLPMVILSYGNSTWNDFITAYNNNVIVYCRASSNNNPKTGTQGRMAFMAYIGFDNSGNPKDVEFQYYRSVSSHSATQMGDQVFIYKLTNADVWSVTTREASPKEIKEGTNQKIGVSWSSNVVTLSNTMTADDMPMSSSDSTKTKAAIDTINMTLGSTTMGTTATTVTGAIAEHESDISSLSSQIGTKKVTNIATGITLWKSGNVVTINCNMNNVTTTTAWGAICTLPEEYRPLEQLQGFYDPYNNIRIIITTFGEIQLANIVTNASIRFTFTYIIE